MSLRKFLHDKKSQSCDVMKYYRDPRSHRAQMLRWLSKLRHTETLGGWRRNTRRRHHRPPGGVKTMSFRSRSSWISASSTAGLTPCFRIAAVSANADLFRSLLISRHVMSNLFHGRRVAQQSRGESPRSSLTSSSYLHVLGGAGGGDDDGRATPTSVQGSVPSQGSMPATMLRHMSSVVGPALNRGLMSASRSIARAADYVESGRQQEGNLSAVQEEFVFDIGTRGSGSPMATRSRTAAEPETRNASASFQTGAGGGDAAAAASSSATGGGQPDPLVTFVEFDPESCCGGPIGRMGKVCLARSAECSVQSHTTKVLQEAGFIATAELPLGFVRFVCHSTG